MLLGVQLQAILYHLFCGWLYGFCFSWLQTLLQYRQHTIYQFLCEVLFHGAASFCLFFGLLQLNGAVTNFYLFAFFLCGAFLYYRFYFTLFYHWFSCFRHFIHKRFHKIAIAKSRMLGIIKKNKKLWKRWRDRRGSKKKKNANNAS